jgi:hypothetical protein
MKRENRMNSSFSQKVIQIECSCTQYLIFNIPTMLKYGLDVCFL